LAKRGSFQLNRRDVGISGGGGNSGRPKASFSRKLGVSSYYYELEHRPTGVKVRGEIPDGHYSRGEMSALKQQLLDRLWSELGIKVAAALRIAGR